MVGSVVYVCKGKVIVCDFFKRLFIYNGRIYNSLTVRIASTCDFTLEFLVWLNFLYHYKVASGVEGFDAGWMYIKLHVLLFQHL